jgi:hypothetical protein
MTAAEGLVHPPWKQTNAVFWLHIRPYNAIKMCVTGRQVMSQVPSNNRVREIELPVKLFVFHHQHGTLQIHRIHHPIPQNSLQGENAAAAFALE